MTTTTTKKKRAPVSADHPRLETKMRSAFGLKRVPFGKDLEPDELMTVEAYERSHRNRSTVLGKIAMLLA